MNAQCADKTQIIHTITKERKEKQQHSKNKKIQNYAKDKQFPQIMQNK